MDWKGLLNWTMKYSDGTVNKDLKPMSEEDMKFVEAAFESVCVNEMKEIMKILDRLKQPELNTEEDIENRITDLQNFIHFIDGPENARNLVRSKRFQELIKYFFTTEHKEIRMNIADALTTMMQNDKLVQEAAMQFNIFNVLDFLNKSQDKVMTTKYIYMLTGILYGEGEKTKLAFMNEYDGIKLLFNLMIKIDFNSIEDSKNFKRLLNIVKELTRIEEKESENYKTRKIAIEKIKEIQMNKMFVELVRNLEFCGDDVNKIEDSLDKMRIIFEIFVNIVKVYDGLAEIFKVITEVNEKLNASTYLDEERKKEEKKFIIHILKSLKTEFAKEEEVNEDNKNTENLVNGVVIEEDHNNGKKTLHLQLKDS
jgi:hypothetical protein